LKSPEWLALELAVQDFLINLKLSIKVSEFKQSANLGAALTNWISKL
jgi:hypothetical protein